jgi:hypothetical protein
VSVAMTNPAALTTDEQGMVALTVLGLFFIAVFSDGLAQVAGILGMVGLICLAVLA